MLFDIEFWIILAVLTAFLSAGRSMYRKHVADNYEKITVIAVTNPFVVLFALPIAGWVIYNGDYIVSPVMFIAGFASAVASFVYVYGALGAYEEGDVSVAKPLLQVTPIATALVEPIFLPAKFSLIVLFGALFAVVGSVITVSNPRDISLDDFNNKMMGFIVLALAAALANILIDKYGAITVDPVLYLLTMYSFLSIMGIIVAYRKDLISIDKYMDVRLVGLSFISLLTALGVIMTYTLISAAVAGVVFQLSLIITVIVGGYIQDDVTNRTLSRRLLGGVFIVLGIVMVYLFA